MQQLVMFWRKFTTAIRIVRDFRDWLSIYRHVLTRIPLTKLTRRDGLVICAPKETQIWNHYNDIVYHESYTGIVHIPDHATVIDIGANVGIFTLYAAQTAKHVYSFEPSVKNFEYLRRNTDGHTNITIYNEGVASFSGAALLDLAKGVTGYRLTGTKNAIRESTETIIVKTLEEILSVIQIKQCDFLKIDCEGAEFQILLNLPPSVLASIENIVLEYHDHLGVNATHLDLENVLRDNGFNVFCYNRRGTFGMIAASRNQKASLVSSRR